MAKRFIHILFIYLFYWLILVFLLILATLTAKYRGVRNVQFIRNHAHISNPIICDKVLENLLPPVIMGIKIGGCDQYSMMTEYSNILRLSILLLFDKLKLVRIYVYLNPTQ